LVKKNVKKWKMGWRRFCTSSNNSRRGYLMAGINISVSPKLIVVIFLLEISKSNKKNLRIKVAQWRRIP
jgi:hypothetical protein